MTAARRRVGGAIVPAVVAGAIVLATAGCTAPGAEPTPAPTASGAAPSAEGTAGSEGTASSGGSTIVYPDGATPETPECQPASEAVVAAVNAAMTVPDYNPTGAPLSVDSLTAYPDPTHAVWLLTGVIDGAPGSEGYFVAWATTADPTLPEFDGTLRSIGGVTAQLSSAPGLQFADGDVAGGLPPAALSCATGG